jgi:hypothetical protein
MTVLKPLWCVGLVLLLCAKCSAGSKEPGARSEVAVASKGSGESRDTLYYLDLTKPTVRQEIDSNTARSGPYKFVQVEVLKVTNPKGHPLTFEVRYRPAHGVETLLGEFSLYPADNPGKFIVPTQGKVREAGEIVLLMTTPDSTASRDVIRVAVRRPRLIKGT